MISAPFTIRQAFACVFISAGLTVANPCAAAGSWPDFRGPNGDGHVSSTGVPLKWGEDRNVKWKIEIPLLGLSSPIVMDNQIWLTTATVAGNDLYVICVDAASGKIIATQKLFHSDKPQSMGNGSRDNSYATPSAVAESGRVYVHYGSFGTACLDASTKEVIWQRDDLRCWHYRGASSSPVLFEDLLILTFDGADLQYLIALDKRTGKTVWKTDRSVAWNDEADTRQMVKDGDWRKAHSTPFIASVAGESVLCSTGAKAAYGYNPRTGKELWRVEHLAYSASPRPVFHNGRFIIVTGFSRGAEMMSIKAGGRGVVTDSHVAWKIEKTFPKYSSPVVVDDLVYFAMDDSFLVCLDTKTGETVWKERVGGKFRASPIYADGRLYFFSLDGVTTVIKPGREFEVLATNKLATEDLRDDPRRGPGFMASPAVVGKAMFLRTRHHLYRIESE
jgi:outer membrane protein assembly factor BamB